MSSIKLLLSISIFSSFKHRLNFFLFDLRCTSKQNQYYFFAFNLETPHYFEIVLTFEIVLGFATVL